VNALPEIVIALIRSWTTLYTCGLPADLRESRRMEIDSDLWEHQHLAQVERAPAMHTVLEMLFRLVMGMPADFTWRLERGSMARAKKRSIPVSTSSRATRLLTVAAFLVVTLMGLIAVSITLRGWQHDTDWPWILSGAIPLFIGAPAILVGLLYAPTRPALSLTLVVVGVLVTALVWFWMFFLVIPLGAGLIALSYHRAKRFGWRASPQPV
jgi:hypothetical protein